MMENDDKLLTSFFAEHRQEIADNGFSRRVLRHLPDGFPCFVVCTEHSYHGMHQVCKASWRYLPACSPFFFSNPID